MRNDEFYMRCAIDMARAARRAGQRPFGCVIVKDDSIIATGWGSETPDDPTRHSEMHAIREACKYSRGLLRGCTMYSTHEPCLMCTGAILHAKISRVVYGTNRRSLPQLFRELNVGLARFRDTSHPPEVVGGVCRTQCMELFDDEVAEALGRSLHRA